MTQSTKALLLCIFVYPGAGQLLLKRYTSSVIFICVTTFGLYFILENVFHIAFQIIDRVQNGEAPPSFISIMELVSQHDTQRLNTAFTAMIVTWVISIIHIYVVKKVP
jgi:hypothetical protein